MRYDVSGRTEPAESVQHSENSMTMTEIALQVIRGDEYDIDFGDTRSFASKRWSNAVNAQNLGPDDREKVKSIDSYEGFSEFIRKAIDESPKPAQANCLGKIEPIARPLRTFINRFGQLTAPHCADMSILWGLLHLSVKLAIKSDEKLKRVGQCLTELRRELEQLNRAVSNCQDDNCARTEITEVFDPLLEILINVYEFQHIYVSEHQVAKAWLNRSHSVEQALSNIARAVNQIQQTTLYSKANQDLETKLLLSRNYGFHTSHVPNEYTAFPVRRLPDIRAKSFYGREAQIDRINEYLGKPELERLRTYLIYGRRGIGKTQIALEYARRYSSKFDAVFWVHCETSASLRQSFADIAVALQLPGADSNGHFEENQMKVLQWLKQTSRTWLLIYDNAENEQLLRGYWPTNARGSILLTSRSYYNLQHDEFRDGDTVPLFTPQERWDLLMQLLGPEWQNDHLGGPNGPLERQAATKLMDSLGGLSLAIVQAAALIKDERVGGDTSIETFHALFEKARVELPVRQVASRDKLTHCLDTVWSIALNALSRNARNLLGVLSLLAPDSIPIDLFLPSNQARLDGRLSFCKRVVSSKFEPRSASTVDPSPAMEVALEELKNAKLVHQYGRNLVIHRVIQEAMNFKGVEDLQESFDAATQLVYEAFPEQELGRPMHDEWPRCQLYIQHGVNLGKTFVESRSGQEPFHSTSEFIKLLSNCAWYLYEVSDYIECLNICQIGCSATVGRTSLLYAHLLNTMGAVYFEINDLRNCRKALEKVRTIRQEHLEPDDLQFATVLANIGNVESAEGNYDEAQDLFESAARIREQYGDDEALMLGLTFMQLGRVWTLRKDYAPAGKMLQKSEGWLMKKPGHNEFFMAHLYYAYGNLAFQKKEFKPALRHYEQCRDLCNKLAPLHPQTASAYYKLGCVEYVCGNGQRALMYLDKSYNITDLRSRGQLDGTKARILHKRGEVLLDDSIRQKEGLNLKTKMEDEYRSLADKIGLRVDPEDVGTDEAFDLLVPGYFR